MALFFIGFNLLACQPIFSRSISLLIGLPKQLSEVYEYDAALLMPSNVTITPFVSPRNLDRVMFDS